MSQFVTGIEGIEKALQAYYGETRLAFARACEKISIVLANYAKQHHPWKDVTGNTTNSIDAKITEVDAQHLVVTLWAGMDYDIFLELAHAGKWAWLWPCVLACMDTIRTILRDEGLPVSSIGSAVDDLAQGFGVSDMEHVSEAMKRVQARRNGSGS